MTSGKLVVNPLKLSFSDMPTTELSSGGPERIRTADLCNANAALYQLSHKPSL